VVWWWHGARLVFAPRRDLALFTDTGRAAGLVWFVGQPGDSGNQFGLLGGHRVVLPLIHQPAADEQARMASSPATAII
jgi:hypothetical protein